MKSSITFIPIKSPTEICGKDKSLDNSIEYVPLPESVIVQVKDSWK